VWGSLKWANLHASILDAQTSQKNQNCATRNKMSESYIEVHLFHGMAQHVVEVTYGIKKKKKEKSF
jgi:hypothetical protein